MIILRRDIRAWFGLSPVLLCHGQDWRLKDAKKRVSTIRAFSPGLRGIVPTLEVLCPLLSPVLLQGDYHRTKDLLWLGPDQIVEDIKASGLRGRGGAVRARRLYASSFDSLTIAPLTPRAGLPLGPEVVVHAQGLRRATVLPGRERGRVGAGDVQGQRDHAQGPAQGEAQAAWGCPEQ